MDVKKFSNNLACKVCMKSKIRVQPFLTKLQNKSVLSVIDADVCGPMKVTLLEGARYFVTFIDNH